MAKRGGGYRAPGNYDPRRGKKGKGGTPSRPRRTGDAGRREDPATPRRGRSAQDDGSGGGAPSRHPAAAKRIAGSQQPSASERPLSEPPPARLEARITRPGEVSGLSFADLGLGGNIVRALAELGAADPFPIQAATIPDALAGHHVLGRGRTGSGKTVAFGAALVERLLRLKAEGAFPDEASREKPKRGERQARPARGSARLPKALILAPTRELALQIDRTVQPLARAVGLFTGQFVGGQPFEPQLHALKRGVDIAIGTPGRIEDLARRGHLSLGRVAVTVIDEADHMAELGFIEPVQRILRQTRRGGQRMLFSATLDSAVDRLVAEFMPSPAVHEVVDESFPPPELVEGGGGPNARALRHFDSLALAQHGAAQGSDRRPVPSVEHRVLIVLREHKDEALVQLVRGSGRTIVFCRTRAYAERVAELLTEAGVKAIALHGDLGQARRERNLAKFADGKADVLVATDIAARGIHVDDVELVLQADPPDDPKAYVHRAGRTGRVNASGRVVTVIPRTRQKRTRELFEQLGFEPAYFGDFPL